MKPSPTTDAERHVFEFVKMLNTFQSPKSDWHHSCLEDLLLAHGRFMPPAPLPEGVERGIMRHCYFNSQEIVFGSRNYRYAEGYALMQDVSLPLLHGWAVDIDDRVIDTTWGDKGKAYFGVTFQTTWLSAFLQERAASERGTITAIFDGNYLEDYSLLRDGLPEAALGW